MGGTTSRSRAQIITDTSIENITKIVQNCVGTATQQQLLEISNVGGDINIGCINQEQSSSIDMTCVLQTQSKQEIDQQVTNNIMQQVNAVGVGVVSALGRTQAETELNVKNMLKTRTANLTSQDVTASINNIQSIKFNNVRGSVIVGNCINQSQTARVVASGILNSTSYQSVINGIATQLDQVAAAKETNPISEIVKSVGDAVGSIVSAPAMVIGQLVLGVVIFIVVIVLIIKFASKAMK